MGISLTTTWAMETAPASSGLSLTRTISGSARFMPTYLYDGTPARRRSRTRRSHTVQPFHGSGLVPSRTRLLPAHARSVRPSRRLLYRGAVAAGLRHACRLAYPGVVARDGIAGGFRSGGAGCGTPRDGGDF